MLVSLCCFAVGAAGMGSFGHDIQQAAWIKLTKFSASLFSYGASLLWLITNIKQDRKRLRRWAAAASIGGVVELLALFLQAMSISYFSPASPLVAELTHVTRLAILPPTLFIVILFKSILSERDCDPVLKRALLWATGLALFGCFPGALMLVPEYAGGSTLATLTDGNISALKLSHFIGLHCLQVLPLCCWLIKRAGLSIRSQLTSISLIGGSLLVCTMLLAIRGILPG